MTREKQIERAWLGYAIQSYHRYDEKSFKEGVEWADKNPKDGMVSLEDVCDFLNDHLYTDTSTGDYDYGQEYIRSDFGNASDLIFALRKVLEG